MKLLEIFGYKKCPICAQYFRETKKIVPAVMRQGRALKTCPKDHCISIAVNENIQRWYRN